MLGDEAFLGRRAVCLFSGGLDSTVTLYSAIRRGFQVYALTLDYGQLHQREIFAAREIAGILGIEHSVVAVPMPWGGSSLLDRAIEVPENRDPGPRDDEIPSTYVPARNSIFLSLGVSAAEARGASAVFFGANSVDYSGYPDCRPEYLEAFQALVRLGTRAGAVGKPIDIEAPLLKLTKKSIVLLGNSLSVPFEKTWSCYRGGESPCGVCDSCRLRARGFQEAGIQDPLL